VNFDDPGTYHFYYGDRTGRPGTLLTFFPWAGAFPGRTGAGQATTVAFAVPAGSLGWWQDRLGPRVAIAPTLVDRFGASTLHFADPDGMALELVEDPSAAGEPWSGAGVDPRFAIRGFSGVTLTLRGADATAQVLTEVLGMSQAAVDGDYRRFRPASPGGGVVDLLRSPGSSAGAFGAGSIHHVAFRARDPGHQLRLRGEVLGHSLGVTPVVDRQYFESIYFREPGGVLFEVATDGPGFLIDEAEEALGRGLRLPPQYEGQRAAIEALLTPVTLPRAVGAEQEAGA
jgi:glyoxalase family protein